MDCTAQPTAVAPTPAPQALPAPPPVALVSRAQDGDFGTAHPFSFVAASPLRTWVVGCQARQDTNKDGALSVVSTPQGDVEGDALDWYYLEAGGATDVSIDAFAGSDAQGRFVALVRDGRMLLRDSSLHTEVVLENAVVEDDAAPYRPHRALSFAPDAQRVAYLQRDDSRERVVLRELELGTERTLELGSELVWRVTLLPGGRWLQAATVLDDTNRNRRLDWPYPKQKGKKRCPLPIPNYAVWSYPGDQPTTRLLDIQSGEILTPAGYVTTLGTGVLTRSDTLELFETRGKERKKLASDKCLGRILAADSTRQATLFGCAEQAGLRRNLYLQTKNTRQDLAMDLAGFEVDTNDARLPRLLALYPHNDTYLLDLETAKLAKLTETSRVLGSFETSALVERGAVLYWVTLDGSVVTETALGRKRPRLTPLLQTAEFLSLGAQLFDLRTRRYVGDFQEPPLALSIDGLGLVPARAGDATRLPQGPLRFRAAELPEP